MLKRVKRKTSKQRSVEKAEDSSVNSSKKIVPSEVELLQQVTAELKDEVKTLKEQLGREKQTSSDVKSLKTQQVCTLTFKLANAVRQRERAEEELAKVQKEMEELKETIKTQEEELKGRERKDAKNDEFNSEVERGEKDKNFEQEDEDAEEVFKTQKEELKCEGSERLTNGESASEHSLTQDENAQQQFRTRDENLADQRFSEVTDEVNKDEKTMACGAEIAFSIHKKDDSTSSKSAINGGSFHLESIQNECEKLLIEDSSLENSPEENTPRDYIPQTNFSPISSLDSSEFEPWQENSSTLDKPEDDFHLDDFHNSSSEINVSSHANSSFETCEEYAEDKDDKMQDFKVPGESSSTVPNVDQYGIPKSLTNPAEKKADIISQRDDPRSARKNGRIKSQNREDQESSPPTSPDVMSSGYASNGANLLGHHGMSEDQSVAVYPGNNQTGRKAVPRRFATKYEKDDVIAGSEKEQDKRSLEGLNTKYQATPTERSRLSTKIDANKRISRERQRDFSSQNVGEEVDELKQQLKSALKEIKELRLENKEMKQEMRKLSTSAEEKTFLVKNTQFTNQLLREMKENDAKMHAHACHTFPTLERYRIGRDLSYSGTPELSPMILQTSARLRRSDECLYRSTRSKTSLPSLKVIGAKLKEITRSVENMAMDPELSGETLPETSAPDFLDYDQLKSHPNLNDFFEKKEQLIIPASPPENLSAERVPFIHETPTGISHGAYTAVEKLGEEKGFDPSNTQHQLTEKDCMWIGKFQVANHAQEQIGSNLSRDTRDHIQRYVVRSSDYIAKLRDLQPEELAFYSKFH